MQNKNIFEEILAVTNKRQICSEITTNYRIAKYLHKQVHQYQSLDLTELYG
jgi:hypothetical protein